MGQENAACRKTAHPLLERGKAVAGKLRHKVLQLLPGNFFALYRLVPGKFLEGVKKLLLLYRRQILHFASVFLLLHKSSPLSNGLSNPFCSIGASLRSPQGRLKPYFSAFSPVPLFIAFVFLLLPCPLPVPFSQKQDGAACLFQKKGTPPAARPKSALDFPKTQGAETRRSHEKSIQRMPKGPCRQLRMAARPLSLRAPLNYTLAEKPLLVNFTAAQFSFFFIFFACYFIFLWSFLIFYK